MLTTLPWTHQLPCSVGPSGHIPSDLIQALQDQDIPPYGVYSSGLKGTEVEEMGKVLHGEVFPWFFIACCLACFLISFVHYLTRGEDGQQVSVVAVAHVKLFVTSSDDSCCLLAQLSPDLHCLSTMSLESFRELRYELAIALYMSATQRSALSYTDISS